MACEGRSPPPPVGPGPDDGPESPSRAVVTPRARAAPDGDSLPLHDHVRRLLARRITGVVNLFGGRGSGKTTALRHLAAVLPPDAPVLLLDQENIASTDVDRSAETRLVVLATRRRTELPHLAAFEMADWNRDDVIEYLLAARPDRCASVMARLKEDSADIAGGVAELWAAVLEMMIASDAVATPAEALRQFLAARLGNERVRRRVTTYCLRQTLNPGLNPDDALVDLPGWLVRVNPRFERLVRLIRHPPVQLLLAAQRVVWDLAGGKGRKWLDRRIPLDLLREIGSLAAFREPVTNELRWIVQDSRCRRAHPAAASILHAAGTDWRPEGSGTDLCGARLEGAKWAGANLCGADLSAAQLGGATLDAARLDDATVASADLSGASLRAASLRRLRATNVVMSDAVLSAAAAPGAWFTAADLRRSDFSAADLHDANFVGAALAGAKLRGACLRGACLLGTGLDGADLSGADLAGARLTDVSLRNAVLINALFREAKLLKCDLRGILLPKAVFRDAVFTQCDLAGSFLPGADFRGATFHCAGLARVRWEGADLRGADFTGASFHTGSSRCGLVGSTMASEGTRTGFYTDDYDDRSYKPPEEIRKAALWGADLRGAKVGETDFYLVDLRRARYSPDQARHFRQCGAIL